MPDLFEDLRNVILEIRFLKEIEHLEELYSDDVIRQNYISLTELENIDFCLDYLSYIDFTKMVSKELLKCVHTMKEDTRSVQLKIRKLKEQKSMIIDDIVHFSSFSVQDLEILFSIFLANSSDVVEFILNSHLKMFSIFIKVNNKLCINDIFREYITDDLLDFVKFYIHIKSWQENLDFESIYSLYVLEQKEEENQFITCIQR